MQARRRSWAPLVVLAVVVPLLAAGVVWLRPRGGDARWRQMRSWAEAAERDWSAHSFARRPLWGAATEGAAFEAYVAALDAARALLKADAELLIELRRDPRAADEDVRDAFARRWAAPLRALGDGAHRRDARPPSAWGAGPEHAAEDFALCLDLLHAATIEVRRRLDRGQPQSAVELSLDSAAFGLDLQGSPRLIDQLVGSSLVALAIGETWRDEDLHVLDAPALELFAAGLEQIDARSPQAPDWRGEALFLARTLGVTGAEEPGPELESIEADALGGSVRSMAADAVLLQVELQERLERAGALPWPERERLLAVEAARPEHTSNPVLHAALSSWSSAELTLRATAARVRLVRVAVALHQERPAPTLADPLGAGTLDLEPLADGRLRVRSVGLRAGQALARTVALR